MKELFDRNYCYNVLLITLLLSGAVWNTLQRFFRQHILINPNQQVDEDKLLKIMLNYILEKRLVNVVFDKMQVFRTGWSLVQRSPTDCGVFNFVWLRNLKQRRRPEPEYDFYASRNLRKWIPIWYRLLPVAFRISVSAWRIPEREKFRIFWKMTPFNLAKYIIVFKEIPPRPSALFYPRYIGITFLINFGIYLPILIPSHCRVP